MVRTTRKPSLVAFRLLTPWMRLNSKLGTSATRSPALATRTWISVSISNPSPHRGLPSSLSGRRSVEVEDGQVPTPEDVVTVAKVRVLALVAEVEE